MNKSKEKARRRFKTIKSPLFHTIMHVSIIIVVYLVLLILRKTNVIDSDLANDIVDIGVISAILITLLSGALASLFVWWYTKKHSEDVRINYENIGIVKKYSLSNLYEYKNGNESVLFPIIVIADAYNKEFKYIDDYNKFYELPQEINKNSKDILSAYKGNVTYNAINVRLDDVKEDNNIINLYTSRTYYYSSLKTNRAPDYILDNGETIREMYEPGPYVRELKDSKMSNHLGFNGFIITSDGYIPLIIRSKDLSIGKKTLGNSVAASLKTKYAIDNSDNHTLKEYPLGESIINEIYDELNLESINLGLNDLGINPRQLEKQIICFYRDLVEVGKPQFLFYTKIKQTKAQLEKSLANNSKIEDKKLKKVLKDGEKALFLSIDDLMNNISITYNSILDKSTNTRYTMMPSAAACIALFKDFMSSRAII
ncbi:hypothetical protein IKQ02_03825 [bacterium]|nr:hypothetical protein [bacterium]